MIDPNAISNDSVPAPASTYPETTVQIDGRPKFAPAADAQSIRRVETRKVLVPPHRMTPLKASWPKIYPPLVEHLKLQVRMNVKSRAVELRTSKHTTDSGALQKGEDFVKAFTLGFDVDDAIALLRLDDLYIETFEIKDVKTLNGEHLGRAIGRIAGKDGKTKFAIENASRTRVSLGQACGLVMSDGSTGRTRRSEDPHSGRLQEHPHRPRSDCQPDPRSTTWKGLWQFKDSGVAYEGAVLVCDAVGQRYLRRTSAWVVRYA